MIVQLFVCAGSGKAQAQISPNKSLILIRSFLLLFLSIYSLSASAQLQEPYRVLLLHGVWGADEWEYSFDNALVEYLQQSESSHIEVSRIYLGLDSMYSPETIRLRKSYVEAQIRERDISLIVSVLPSASDYLRSLDVPESVPKLLMLPDAVSEALAEFDANTAVVHSAAPAAMRATIEQIRLLKPDISTIDVLAGTDITDRTYLEIAQELSVEYRDQFTFRFHVGESPEHLLQLVGGLDASTVILDVPLESYTLPSGDQERLSRESFRQILQASAVPVFTFYENEIGTGITGGFIASTRSYARAAARQVLSRASGNGWQTPEPNGAGSTIYDWQLAQRFDLDLDRLGVEYELVNRQLSLLETNRSIVLLAVNALALLVLIVVFLGVLLRRSSIARLRIAESERAARESESRFKLLALNTIDVIWTWDYASNTMSYCSPSVEQLTGFTPEEFISRPAEEMLTPDSIDACRQLFTNPQAGSMVLELEHYTKGGGTVWCELSAQPILGKNKKNTLVGVTRDITQRKRHEAEREQFEASARQNQKFESLGTLAGGIAHDFNNILAVMVGITDMLGRRFADNEDAKKLLSILESSTHRATGLVKQILTFSRQSDGDRTVVALAGLIEASAQILKVGIPQSVKFETELKDAELHVLADRVQIEQVVMNIVTNALQALDGNTGEIRLLLSSCEFASAQKFTHGEVEAGSYALIEVSDTGTGISASQIDRIFDPFFTSKELGNGMGLAIVRGVIIKHGGALAVSSQPGKGTTFSIYLPLTDQSPAEGQVQLPGSMARIQRRILVIDDQAELLEILTMMVDTLGHDVIGCNDPVEALELIANEGDSLDLVITDYSMPKINGLQIIDACAKGYPKLRVVLCSGFGESLPENAEELFGAKVPLLQKPFTIATLEAMLEEMFAGSQA